MGRGRALACRTARASHGQRMWTGGAHLRARSRLLLQSMSLPESALGSFHSCERGWPLVIALAGQKAPGMGQLLLCTKDWHDRLGANLSTRAEPPHATGDPVNNAMLASPVRAWALG